MALPRTLRALVVGAVIGGGAGEVAQAMTGR